MIADARQRRCDRAQARALCLRRRSRQRVFGFEHEAVQVRQDAEHGLAGLAFEPVEPGLQQRDIAAKTIDHETGHARAFARREQGQRADQMREHARRGRCGDQVTGQSTVFGIAQVGDVAIAQIDLGRTAGAFDDQPHRTAPAGVRARRARPRRRCACSRDNRERPCCRSNDRARDLRAGVAVRFSSTGLKSVCGRQPTGLRLHRLCATDLAAIDGDRRVQRHVLRLERRHLTSRRCSQRQSAVTSALLPASEVQPCTISTRAVHCGSASRKA